MFKSKKVWLVCSTFHSTEQVEFTISQEGYSRLEDAKEFCESRNNGQVYDLDEFTYVSEPDSRGTYYEYKIIEISVN